MALDFWNEKNVVVTGPDGFLGRHLSHRLNQTGCKLFLSDREDFDFRYPSRISDLMWANDDIDVLFHLAANVGGIGYNQENAYDLFYDNAIMGINLIHASIKNVKKFIQVGTTCSYPKHCPTPFHPSNFWNGYPEETNAAYGLAKKMLLVQLQAARKQFGFNGIYPVLTNLYGPGDDFSDEKSHVIPALIKKFIKGIEKNLASVRLWGTGEATRDFLYIDDAVTALILAAEMYNEPEPLNVGSGESYRIAALADMIKDLVGYSGEIIWDDTKPDGQPKRLLNSEEINDLGWKTETPLKKGLKKTIEWYKEYKNKCHK